jgi:Fe2+ or Zn2+ uptake regulation protein
MRDDEVAAVLARAAKAAGFSITGATIEAEGLCSTCDAAVTNRASTI